MISKRNADLLSVETCANTIDGVTNAAVASGTRSLLGATWIGHAICGAAVANSKGTLRLWRSGDSGPVLVVDGVTASRFAAQAVQMRLIREGLETSVHVVEIFSDGAPSDGFLTSPSAGICDSSESQRSLATVA